jgi:hypothetical protein
MKMDGNLCRWPKASTVPHERSMLKVDRPQKVQRKSFVVFSSGGKKAKSHHGCPSSVVPFPFSTPVAGAMQNENGEIMVHNDDAAQKT